MDFASFTIRYGVNSQESSYALQREGSTSGGSATLGSTTMQATIGCLSRIVSRTLVSGAQQSGAAAGGSHSPGPFRNRACSTSTDSSSEGHESSSPSHDHNAAARLVTAVSGFPKASAAYNIDHILKGQIGDDAYFIARHLDDWNAEAATAATGTEPSESASSRVTQPLPCTSTRKPPQSQSHSPPTVDQLLNPMAAASLADNTSERRRHPSSSGSNSADVIGVADGVGGWRQYGVDPGQFSMQLMQACERLVKAGYFVSDQPARLLAQGFSEMQASKKPVIGSSTACLAMLSHADGKLYTANIGDSGLLVVRDGQVVHRSSEQQHYFNTPYQLSLPPTDMESDVLADLPEAADRYEFNVEDGDVIILATDGIFDNVPDHLLVEQIDSLRGCTNDASAVQACANSIALIARSLSRDDRYLSPFAKNARASGFKNVLGGKEDDVTVILAAVNYNAA